MITTPVHQPRVERVNVRRLEQLKWLERLLTCLLIISGTHVLIYYMWLIFHPDVTQESMAAKYAIYIAIGSFFYLFVYNKAIAERWGAKDVPPYDSKLDECSRQIAYKR